MANSYGLKHTDLAPFRHRKFLFVFLVVVAVYNSFKRRKTTHHANVTICEACRKTSYKTSVCRMKVGIVSGCYDLQESYPARGRLGWLP